MGVEILKEEREKVMLSQLPQNSAIFLLHIPFLICARNRWPVVLLGSNLPAFDKKEGKGLCIESSKNNIAWPNWNMRKVKTFIYVTGNLFPSFHSSRSLSCQECPSIWQRSQHENISPGYINLFQCPYHNAKCVYIVESFMSGDEEDKGAGEMNHRFI